ncbi:MAG: HNH endonuclease [Syntrophobacterales bacterium]|jgi:5-methylcytosine-specific restriction endonuclease McrA|nr:HNH endonuclease [Syntrophobacterales bacterium]
MDRTLLLNTSFEPINVLPWKKAVTLIFLGKVEVLKEYEREIKGVSATMRHPAVIRLLRLVRNRHINVKFSRKNIFLRDNYTCQYCGKKFEPKSLTCDHIIPRSRGGTAEWTNIVTSCLHCNVKKGDKMPDEAGMSPRKRPSRPRGFYMLMLLVGVNVMPDYWKDYIFSRD